MKSTKEYQATIGKQLQQVRSLEFPSGLTQYDPIVEDKGSWVIETLPSAVYACAQAFMEEEDIDGYVRSYESKPFGPIGRHLRILKRKLETSLPLVNSLEADYLDAHLEIVLVLCDAVSCLEEPV